MNEFDKIYLNQVLQSIKILLLLIFIIVLFMDIGLLYLLLFKGG